MTRDEVVGPAGPKLVRLLYFVGAGCNDLLLLYASTIDQFTYARRRSTSGEIFNGSPFNYLRSRQMRYRKQSNNNQSPRVLGFHQSSDNFTAAITYYHKVLWLKPDDQFCTEMLTLALVDECRHGVEPKIDSCQNDLFLY
ncbi:hypothetical protein RHSIM_Rhsim08G0243300 [Rhododendron simsii]|uniref:Uncharacterized protein n=1 Tax=Rhododendron simsii TaxID=118357 RepID=A0A834LG62_RHOSS|nr:hypothetical protein RHSIM_Rhsim08G0243300 [Rhododendron simsii]